jgi:hypothetical protein
MLRIIALLLSKFLRAGGICDGEFRMRYLRAALMTGALCGHCSCSALSGVSDVSKSEQIICQVGSDCDLKWERAYRWVVESSGLNLKTKTDGLIKTAESPGNDRVLVVTITKNSTSQSGTYEIDFIGKCLSIWSCVPSVAESRTKFVNFVLAAD